MKPRTTHIIVASLATALAWSPGPARAEMHGRMGVAATLTPVQTAQFIFETAAELMKERKFALACMLFEKSYGIDPAVGTQFYLADCYEQTGRLVQAWSTFREVMAAAEQQKRPDRVDLARRRALSLIPRMGKIVMVFPPAGRDLSSLALTVDDTPVAKEKQVGGAELLQVVDPGQHVIVVSSGGKVRWREKVRVESGNLIRIVIPDLPPAETKRRNETSVGTRPETRGSAYVVLDSKNPYE